MGFMMIGCPSLSYLLPCGPSLFCLMSGSLPRQSLGFFRGDYSISSCRFRVFVGGGEFRNLLHHHAEPWSVFLTADFSLLIKEWACQASGWTMGGDAPEKGEGADVYSDQLLFPVYCTRLCLVCCSNNHAADGYYYF